MFKFRVWQCGLMRPLSMCPPRQRLALLEGRHPDQAAITMQWTGLVDRAGVEIYEGDIVEAWSHGKHGTFEVRWRQEACSAWLLYPAYQQGEMWYLFGSRNRQGQFVDVGVKVLGNVYEHPHLAWWDDLEVQLENHT